MKPRIFVSSNLYALNVTEALDILNGVGEVVLETSGPLMTQLRDIDASVFTGMKLFTSEMMGFPPRLKMIAVSSVGFDKIDVAAATERGIIVTNVAGVVQNAVADLTIGLMIDAVRQISWFDRDVRSGRWVKKIKEDLWGKTLGIVGLGEIGSEVARRAVGFRMKILYYDIRRNPRMEEEIGVKFVSFEALLRESDIISLHVSLNSETKGIMGKDQFAQMKDGAYFVNTARGGLVDEKALYEALRKGKLAGAGLDVLLVEKPGANNPLYQLDNVVFTPHIGSITDRNNEKLFIRAAENVKLFLEGRRPLCIVNPQVLQKFPNLK